MRQIKIPRNANMLEKYRELKMPRKFDAAKISCNKVSFSKKIGEGWDEVCSKLYSTLLS